MTTKNPQVKPRWMRAAISPSASLRDAAESLSKSSLRICLVVDEMNRLIGTVTDGDIRRGLLRGLELESSVMEIANFKPLVVSPGMSHDFVSQIMTINKLFQLPEVGSEGQVLDLHTIDEINSSDSVDALIIIMAGGKGTRMLPHTANCPKPMLLVNGRPMMAHIVDQARAEGFSRIAISVNYLGNIIEDYFGDGRKFGVDIEYIREVSPLGTAGALSLIEKNSESLLLVINGDVLSGIRFRDIIDFHKRYEAAATMAVQLHQWRHPFGVIELNGVDICGFEEKPVLRSHINAGIYVLSPDSLVLLKKHEHCDMPELFNRIRLGGRRIVAFPMHEPWLDVGRPQDLSIANLTK